MMNIETFLEIFEYLDGYDLYYIFAKLNTRFHNLFYDRNLLLKIQLRTGSHVFMNSYFNYLLYPNHDRLLSLKIPDVEPSDLLLRAIYSGIFFNRLESLMICNIPTDTQTHILRILASLPRLFSLTIHNDIYKNCKELFHYIYYLPTLKSLKISVQGRRHLLTLFLDTSISTIQHLILPQYLLCNFRMLISLAPQLKQLVCNELIPSHWDPSMGPCHLTHLSINICDMNFDRFQTFIESMGSQLQVLRLKNVSHFDFIDANRWEQLIVNFVSGLRILNVKYETLAAGQLDTEEHVALVDSFTSTFWSERHWTIYVETRFENVRKMRSSIIYSIGSSKENGSTV
ncbi:unnamed protein product [Adineta ricciae]|uniref:F-box domain-containing protein n=1 Tax=Adineta ricciae TaxID=249248 RepID=A0A815GYE1_ADIRI|nr:unnamed protein product [Adineta ricciae]